MQYLNNGERCYYDLHGLSPYVHGRPVVWWTLRGINELTFSLCKPCLDQSLDGCDRIDTEPAALTWIEKWPHRWCMEHHWPAEVCLDWRHGPDFDPFGQRVARCHAPGFHNPHPYRWAFQPGSPEVFSLCPGEPS